LPISWSFSGAAGGDDDNDNNDNDISVLLHQVTQRQSAQSDVGFGTYISLLVPTSIILSLIGTVNVDPRQTKHVVS
jgi:hypothetical protein